MTGCSIFGCVLVYTSRNTPVELVDRPREAFQYFHKVVSYAYMRATIIFFDMETDFLKRGIFVFC